MLHDRAVPVAHSYGPCRYCWRDMWDGQQIPEGKTRVARCRTMCATCARWIERTGTDPRTARCGPAERLSVEEAEPDDLWKLDPERRCADLPTEFFFSPELDRDDPEYVRPSDAEREEAWAERRRVAAGLCAQCPFAAQCLATAKAMGYEGLWGGAWFTRTRWQNLITNERGVTIHAAKKDRERVQGQEAA